MEAPIGTIIVWTTTSFPSGWQLCDGSNGTPDLRNKFARGASVDADLPLSGGAESHSHTLPSTSARASHDHGGSASGSCGGPSSTEWGTVGTYSATVASSGHNHSGVNVAIGGADSHSHTIGNAGSSNNLPTHIKLYFIMKISN